MSRSVEFLEEFLHYTPWSVTFLAVKSTLWQPFCAITREPSHIIIQ